MTLSTYKKPGCFFERRVFLWKSDAAAPVSLDPHRSTQYYYLVEVSNYKNYLCPEKYFVILTPEIISPVKILHFVLNFLTYRA